MGTRKYHSGWYRKDLFKNQNRRGLCKRIEFFKIKNVKKTDFCFFVRVIYIEGFIVWQATSLCDGLFVSHLRCWMRFVIGLTVLTHRVNYMSFLRNSCLCTDSYTPCLLHDVPLVLRLLIIIRINIRDRMLLCDYYIT